MKAKAKRKLHEYCCDNCSKDFTSTRITHGKYHCGECKRTVPKFKVPINITDISSRTISKLLKRANIKCSMCNWDRTSLDLHHIIERKNGGNNEDDNLIPLCPNCHRMAHENQYTIEQLKLVTLDKVFSNWKDYYNQFNGPVQFEYSKVIANMG